MDNGTIYILASDGVTSTKSDSDNHARVGLVVGGLAAIGAYIVVTRTARVINHMRYRKYYKK